MVKLEQISRTIRIVNCHLDHLILGTVYLFLHFRLVQTKYLILILAGFFIIEVIYWSKFIKRIILRKDIESKYLDSSEYLMSIYFPCAL
jgi:hypothetical protein